MRIIISCSPIITYFYFRGIVLTGLFLLLEYFCILYCYILRWKGPKYFLYRCIIHCLACHSLPGQLSACSEWLWHLILWLRLQGESKREELDTPNANKACCIELSERFYFYFYCFFLIPFFIYLPLEYQFTFFTCLIHLSVEAGWGLSQHALGSRD